MWLIYALSASILWGLDYSLNEKLLANKISALTLLAVQMFIGSILFIIIGFFTQRLKNDYAIIADNKAVLYYTIAAIIVANSANLLIFLSISAKNATIAGIIELCYPIFTILFTWILFKQNHLTPSVIIGGILIGIGIFIIGYFQ